MFRKYLVVFVLGFSSLSAVGQKRVVTPNVTCPDCDPDPPGGGGDGGGGSPYATPDASPSNPIISTSNYTLTPTFDFSITAGMGGVMRREAPGAAVYNGLLYIASVVRGATTDLTYRPGNVFVGAYNGQSVVSSPLDTGIYSTANPALLTVSDPLAGFNYLLLAVNNVSVGQTNLYVSSGGAFSYVTSIGANADYSPSLAYADGYIYVGLRNSSNQRLTLCKMQATQLGYHPCVNYVDTRQMNENPSLAIINLYGNPTLYIGYQEFDDVHELRMYTAGVGNPSAFPGTLPAVQESNSISTNNGDQTSTAPSLAAYNGTLYVGFRTNDSDHKFLYRWTEDGVNFAVRQYGGYLMGSAPTLVNGNGLPYNGNSLYNLFSTEHHIDQDNHSCTPCNADDTMNHDLIVYHGHP